VRFHDNEFLQGGVISLMLKPPTWRTRVSVLVWHLPQNLSAMRGPTSSYVTAGIAFEFIVHTSPPHPATKCFRQGGDTIEGECFLLTFLNCHYLICFYLFDVILCKDIIHFRQSKFSSFLLLVYISTDYPIDIGCSCSSCRWCRLCL
jgi:hypothetical protein